MVLAATSPIEGEARRWLGEIAGGTVVRAERALSRREGWLVDIEGDDRSSRPLFVRVASAGDPMNSFETLDKEARLARLLVDHGVRVAPLVGARLDLGLAAYERLPGVSDISTLTPDQQQAVYERFLDELAAVHRLDLAALGLDDWPRPASALEAALAGLDALRTNYEARLASPDSRAEPSPLVAYGLRWLRERAPSRLDDVTLVHGDAGTPNFLFLDGAITGLIDWEWARLGDPMEDLGNAALHAVFHPSGDWPALLAHYERSSGLAVDVDRVAYWRAHMAVRSVVALHTATAVWSAHDPMALNLCYRIVSDRICCECLAEHDGIELERPPLPMALDDGPSLPDAVADVVDHIVRPAVEGTFARGRAREAALLIRAIARDTRARQALDAIDLDELTPLVGHRPADAVTGRRELTARIADGTLDDDGEVLRYLARRAWREEQVWAPVVSLFPGLELRPLR